MSEHEHTWNYSMFEYDTIECDKCGKRLDEEIVITVLNNPTVKTIINVVIARRDDEDKNLHE